MQQEYNTQKLAHYFVVLVGLTYWARGAGASGNQCVPLVPDSTWVDESLKVRDTNFSSPLAAMVAHSPEVTYLALTLDSGTKPPDVCCALGGLTWS